MQTIVPNIWCNGNAVEAAEFYADVFPDSAVTTIVRYPTEGLLEFQKPLAGQPLTVDVSIKGYQLTLINADDTFTPNASVSFMVTSPDVEETTRLWQALVADGQVLMELGEYPHNPCYGWVQDKYGVSWQLMTAAGDASQAQEHCYLVPVLMFGGAAQNRSLEAMQHYTGIIEDSAIEQVVSYQDMGVPIQPPLEEDSIVFANFTLAGQRFAAMDSAVPQDFSFTGGIAFLVNAHGQEHIDRYWEALSAEPAAERCGWLRDKFGLSWEIVPDNLDELMAKPGAYTKLMEMTKIVIDEF